MKRVVVASVDDEAGGGRNLDADYVVDEKARTATLTARGTPRPSGISTSKTSPTLRTPPPRTTSTRRSRPTAS